MKNKFFLLLPVLVIIFTLTIIPCSALGVSPYANLVSTATNANNLISYARSYDTFIYSDFVVLQSGDYEYYIVWGDDFTVNGSTVTGTDIEYIKYYRTSSSGYTSNYIYDYGTDSTFNLTLNEYVITSNINVGMSSSVYDSYKANYNITYLIIILVSIGFASMLVNFRRAN